MIEGIFSAILILLPFQFALNAGENMDLVTTRIVIPVVFLLWLFRGLALKKIWIPSRAETWLAVSFLFLALLSLPAGLGWENGIRKIFYLASIFPVYFVAADLAKRERNRIVMLRAVWISGALAAVVGLFQFFLPFLIGIGSTLKIWKNVAVLFLGSSFGKIVTENPSWLVNISGKTWMRAFGFFPDPHVFSFFVSLCFFVGLGYFFWEKNIYWKAISGAAAVLMFFSILLSFSRGAYVGMIAGGGFFLFLFLFSSGKKGKIALATIFLVLFAGVFFNSSIQSRLISVFNMKEGSNAERMKNWKEALDIIRDYPFFGAGLGNYSLIVDPSSGQRSSIYAHNIFLDIAAETGILSGAIFFALLLTGIWRRVKVKNMIGAGIASGFIYFLFHGMFDTSLWSPQVMVILLVMLAMGTSLSSGKQSVSQVFAETKN